MLFCFFATLLFCFLSTLYIKGLWNYEILHTAYKTKDKEQNFHFCLDL